MFSNLIISNPAGGGAGVGDAVLADNQTFTGLNTFSLSPNIARTDLAAGTALALNTNYYVSLAANRTLTFTGTPAEGSNTSLKVIASATITLTIPSCKRFGDANVAITSITLYPGVHFLAWSYIGGEYVLADTVGVLYNLAATASPVVGDDQVDGYSVGSIWVDVTGDNVFICVDASTGAAVWHQVNNALVSAVPVALGGTGGTSATEAWENLTVASVAIAALEVDWSSGPVHRKTLAANSTFTFANSTDGQTIVVALTNTASNYTVTWPAAQWAGGAQPVQTVGAKTDIWTFVNVNGTIYGSVSQDHS